ncbi:hypothetical protein CHS0354_022319 [Potamilus streckersoni]|uniref:LysM domain-containing protein n=1 Tax=Potamilus streckersoni TaxID=2493646 RepID=A0AAE0WCH2_9BIVA|nr:hypothetical protein CHS0354_022319 [Potamilus streckersoni]
MTSGYYRPTHQGSLVDPQLTQKNAQVQNVKQAKVYVFGDGQTLEDDVDAYELSQIHTRKGRGNRPLEKLNEPLFIERELTKADTLQSLSLQYGCPVFELKRVNKLIQDQEFYALRRIKVPVKRHSFLTEFVVDSKLGTSSSDRGSLQEYSNGAVCRESGSEEEVGGMAFARDSYDSDASNDLSDPEKQRLLIRTLSISKAVQSQGKEIREFLKNKDNDLAKIQSLKQSDRHSLDEVISVLTNKSIQPNPIKKKIDGADCGIRWWSISLVAFLVFVLVAVFLVLYYTFLKHS